MSNPLTDTPTPPVPFDRLAPDYASLPASELRKALEYWDSTPVFPIATFEFPDDPYNTTGHAGQVATFRFRLDYPAVITFEINVGAAPATYEDEWLALWFVGSSGGVWYRVNVKSGKFFRDQLYLGDTGLCALVMVISRRSAPTDIAPLSVDLSLGKIEAAPNGSGVNVSG